jgi:hypothetical protein
VMSWGDSKKLTVLQTRLRALRDDDTTAEEMMAVFDELNGLMARFVTFVPQSWLVDGAPEGLDWGDPASFDWMRSDKVGELQRAMVEARTPEAVSGN